MFRKFLSTFAFANGTGLLKRNITTIASTEPVLPNLDPDAALAEMKKYAEAHPDSHVELPPDLKNERLKRSDDPKFREIGLCTWFEEKKR